MPVKAPALLVIACALWGGCVSGGLFAAEVNEFPDSLQPVPEGSATQREIQDGYRLYYDALASAGRWSVDPLYGVRWVPGGVDPKTFSPYRSGGHWAPSPSADVPFWVNDDPAPWREITMHHGWWVYEARVGQAWRWCWIPGVEATPGRVVWRMGDVYVGWAPEPPLLDPIGEDDDLLEWVYEFTANLFDAVLENAILGGDAADIADEATHRARTEERRGGHGPRRSGPPRTEVAGARTSLSEYLTAHPDVAEASSGHGSHAGGRSGPSSGFHVHSSGSSSTGSSELGSSPSPPTRGSSSHSSGSSSSGGSSSRSSHSEPGGCGGHSAASHSGGGHR
jgi:hypothetical protein